MQSSATVARLAFLSFKLVGRKNFSWPYGLILSRLALKNAFSFLAILRWNRFLRRKILLFHFLRQHICKVFVINAISDAAFWY